MRALTLLILVFLLTLVGCTAHPRYRTGSAVKPREVHQISVQFSTEEYIRFGLIIEKYLGKPYAGSSKWEEGLDCSKFTSDVYKSFNRTNLPRKAADQFKEGRNIPRSRLKFGDLVFFNTNGRGISHVGIAIGYNEFVHASSSRGVIISDLSEKYWAKRFVGARRIIEPHEE